MELLAIVTKNCKKNKDPTCNIRLRLYGTMKKVQSKIKKWVTSQLTMEIMNLNVVCTLQSCAEANYVS